MRIHLIMLEVKKLLVISEVNIMNIYLYFLRAIIIILGKKEYIYMEDLFFGILTRSLRFN